MLPIGAITSGRTIVDVLGTTLHTTFKLAQIPYFLGMGGKEIFYDSKKESFESTRNAADVGQKIFEALKTTVKQLFCYEVIHGVLMLACGACESVASIHRVGIATIALHALSVLSYVSLGCFGLANFIMTCQQVRILLSVMNIPDNASQEVKDAARSIKISAIIGLLSGLCYLVGIALVLCGAPAAIVVLFMLLGLLGGGCKILYDLIVEDKSEVLNQYKILIKYR